MTKPLDPDALEQTAALLFSEAMQRAVDLGHNLEPGWHDTEPYSWVAQCLGCMKWLALDLGGDMGRHPFGLVDLVCAGYQVGPAPRRLEEDLAPRNVELPKPTDAWLPERLNYRTQDVPS